MSNPVHLKSILIRILCPITGLIFLIGCSLKTYLPEAAVTYITPAKYKLLDKTTFKELYGESRRSDYLQITINYANFMLRNGRDRYGEVSSPLFATTMNRNTGDIYKNHPPRPPKGIRKRDRTHRGANPSMSRGFVGLLHRLTALTKIETYSQEADTSILWFFKNCQIKKTGLLPWGEHMGWDFYKERIITSKFQFWVHEMKGFSQWDLVWEKVPESADRFAMGLWDHQIYAKEGKHAGEYSRHTAALFHWPMKGKAFPSHGGKYIIAWAKAWQYTGNTEYLRAISTVLNYFERNKSPKSGALRYATSFPDHLSLGHNMGLVDQLESVRDNLPDTLRLRMIDLTQNWDSIYLSFAHDPTPDGIGFIKSANVHTLEPGEFRSKSKSGNYSTKMWGSGYTASASSGTANDCLDRFQKTGIQAYKNLFLISAEAYYQSEIPKAKVLYPRNYSGIIGMMLDAYRITDERRFLDKAIAYADVSIEAVMDQTSPLPKASNTTTHYEAITGADGLMNNLLSIWLELNKNGI